MPPKLSSKRAAGVRCSLSRAHLAVCVRGCAQARGDPHRKGHTASLCCLESAADVAPRPRAPQSLWGQLRTRHPSHDWPRGSRPPGLASCFSPRAALPFSLLLFSTSPPTPQLCSWGKKRRSTAASPVLRGVLPRRDTRQALHHKPRLRALDHSRATPPSAPPCVGAPWREEK